jgi:hypothetical protein
MFKEQELNNSKIDNNSKTDNKLNTIKYKTMVLNNLSWPDSKSANDLNSLDKFLEKEKEKSNTNSEPWSKQDKTSKIKRLTTFAIRFKDENNLSEEECQQLITFFRDCLDRKKLLRVKDVICDKETGEIKSIPALQYNKTTNNYTLKNIDKRVSTIKSLGPTKKINGTIKHISENDSDSDNE